MRLRPAERTPWLLLATGLVLWLAKPSAGALKPPSLKTTTAAPKTTEDPPKNEAATEAPPSPASTAPPASNKSSLLTGVPQVDYVHDPNLPRELNGANLRDYPFYSGVPDNITFPCDGLKDGFYASIEHKCQVYHHCLFGTRYDFLCANYTAFDQRTFICHFVSEVDCENSPKYFNRNEALYKATTTTTLSPPPRAIYDRPPPAEGPRRGASAPRRRRPYRRRRPVYEYYYDDEEYDHLPEEEYYDDEPSPSSTQPTTPAKPRRRKRPGSGAAAAPATGGGAALQEATQDTAETTGQANTKVRTQGTGSVFSGPRPLPKVRRPVPLDEHARTTAAPAPPPPPPASSDYYDDEEEAPPPPQPARHKPSRPAAGARRPEEDDDEEYEDEPRRPRPHRPARRRKPSGAAGATGPGGGSGLRRPPPPRRYKEESVEYDDEDDDRYEEPAPAPPRPTHRRRKRPHQQHVQDSEEAPAPSTAATAPPVASTAPAFKHRPKQTRKPTPPPTPSPTPPPTPSTEAAFHSEEDIEYYDDDELPPEPPAPRTTTSYRPRTRAPAPLPTTPAVTRTTAAVAEETIQPPRSGRRPFLPSRGGNPVLPRGLLPLGAKAKTVPTTTTTTTTTTAAPESSEEYDYGPLPPRHQPRPAPPQLRPVRPKQDHTEVVEPVTYRAQVPLTALDGSNYRSRVAGSALATTKAPPRPTVKTAPPPVDEYPKDDPEEYDDALNDALHPPLTASLPYRQLRSHASKTTRTGDQVLHHETKILYEQQPQPQQHKPRGSVHYQVGAASQQHLSRTQPQQQQLSQAQPLQQLPQAQPLQQLPQQQPQAHQQQQLQQQHHHHQQQQQQQQQQRQQQQQSPQPRPLVYEEYDEPADRGYFRPVSVYQPFLQYQQRRYQSPREPRPPTAPEYYTTY